MDNQLRGNTMSRLAISAPPRPARLPRPPDEQLRLSGAVPFFTVHLAAVLGVFLVDCSWSMVFLCVAMYYARMFGVAAGFHRYFAHRTFKTSRQFQFVLAVLGTTAAQRGPGWWPGKHREHHRYADTALDVHSPSIQGFWWAHMLWFLCAKHDGTPEKIAAEFKAYPEIGWLDRNYLLPPLGLALTTLAIWGIPGLFWGFFLSTVLLWHGTFTVNSVMHLASVGCRRYQTNDTSRNVWWLWFVTLGENWHNNHHHYESSEKQGFYWWEIDLAHWGLVALSRVGVVWDIKRPTPAALAGYPHESATGPPAT